MLTKKRILLDMMKIFTTFSSFAIQMKSDRVAQLRQEIADMERQQEMAQENFERISRLIKKEVEAFQEKKVKDFK